MESFGIFHPPIHNMGGQYRDIHIRDVSHILDENTLWQTLKLQGPLYRHHSEGAHVHILDLGKYKGQIIWGWWECWDLSITTERSDIGPHPPTHVHSEREW